MEFFGMGTGEIFLILVVALIIWGPGRIVDVGRTLGKMMHNLKKATSDLTTQITSEMEEKKTSTTAQKAQPLNEQEHK
jgi:TatA/E family protein of Tat protein translocase